VPPEDKLKDKSLTYIRRLNTEEQRILTYDIFSYALLHSDVCKSLEEKHNTDTVTSFAPVLQLPVFPPERAARRIHFKRSTVHHLVTVQSAPHNMLTLTTFRGGTT